MLKETTEETVCYHCGEACDHTIEINEKPFCCEGCKTVYQILNKEALCNYYKFNPNPGISRKYKDHAKFALLEDEMVKTKLIHFKDEKQSHVVFYLPQMHCSSCIWLLENLNKLNNGVIQSRVNFLKKEVSVIFDHSRISLRKLAELCDSVGYEPHISLNDITGKEIKKYDRSRIYKIGIAGFCFGNVMLLSFPEYFSFGEIHEAGLKKLFSVINLFLALPVFFSQRLRINNLGMERNKK
jgi:P-type Cu+ transporter